MDFKRNFWRKKMKKEMWRKKWKTDLKRNANKIKMRKYEMNDMKPTICWIGSLLCFALRHVSIAIAIECVGCGKDKKSLSLCHEIQYKEFKL